MASSPGLGRSVELPYHTTVDARGEDAASVSVVEAIATVRGVEATEVGFRLDEYVEPEALDRLYRHAGGDTSASWSLEFEVDEFVVTVRSDGRIAVE